MRWQPFTSGQQYSSTLTREFYVCISPQHQLKSELTFVFVSTTTEWYVGIHRLRLVVSKGKMRLYSLYQRTIAFFVPSVKTFASVRKYVSTEFSSTCVTSPQITQFNIKGACWPLRLSLRLSHSLLFSYHKTWCFEIYLQDVILILIFDHWT